MQVGGTTQSTGSITVRNNADAEAGYYLWPGLTTSQKGTFTYKDWNGNSQWYMVKDTNNNWALNSATGGLDSFKAYQSTNSGDTYVDASNSTGHIRFNYETGSGAETDIYSGSSSSLDAAFVAPNAIKFPGLAASSGDFCLQIDNSGYISNTGSPCGTGSGSGGVNGTINSGSTGQVAYYTANGTSIGGMGAVPLTAGGTGTNSANGALANLGALSAAATTPQTFASPLTGPSITASVNAQINVMAPPYNAKGDCATDDHNAILAALNAANAIAPPAPVYFPAPPGGCYLTSTLPWYGLSLIGQPPIGIGPAIGSAGVVIKGKPGEDIFEAPDPTTVTSAAPHNSWSIRDITFLVDDSVDASASFPHRWPGRWVQDASMSAGSPIITSPHAGFTCGDVGQAIQVNGAGPSGANLVTTILSVTPCMAVPGPTPTFLTVTLAANATTPASNVSAYISVAGLPVTAHVGNAALAFDCKDANSADWTMAGSPGNNADVMENVQIGTATGAYQHSSAGIYSQACYSPYNFYANNTMISAPVYGVVFGVAELNTYDSMGLADYMHWHGGDITASYPWISYDGLYGTMDGVQLYSPIGYGPQLLISGIFNGDVANYWSVNVPELETGASTAPGWRVEGGGHKFTNTFLGGVRSTSVGATWDASDSSCVQCGAFGTLSVNGSRNRITLTSEVNPGILGVVYNGIGNQVSGTGYESSPANGLGASHFGVLAKSILDQPAGVQTTDFIRSGNVTTPYPNDNDLIFGPEDFSFGYPVLANAPNIILDSTALFGKYYAWGSGSVSNFANLFTQNTYGGALIGTQVPAIKATVYANVKCPTSTSFTITVYAGATNLGSASPSCSTAYTTGSVAVDFSSYSTQPFAINVTTASTDAEVAYVAIRPFQHDYNGQQPVLSSTPIGTSGGGAAVPTGPANTTSGDVVTYTGTAGQQQDSGMALSSLTAKAGTGSCASGQYETGDTAGGPSCAQVAYSQISGTPSGLAAILGGAIRTPPLPRSTADRCPQAQPCWAATAVGSR